MSRKTKKLKIQLKYYIIYRRYLTGKYNDSNSSSRIITNDQTMKLIIQVANDQNLAPQNYTSIHQILLET